MTAWKSPYPGPFDPPAEDQVEMVAALEEARANIVWWAEEHGCCKGQEVEALARIDAALSNRPATGASHEQD